MSEQPPRPRPEQLARYAELFNQSLSLKHFGFRVAFPDERTVHVTLDAREEHRGGLGSGAVINGGVLAAAFDLALGCSAALVDPTRRSATVQLSMSFERAVRGETMRVEATVDRASTHLVFASALLFDGAGEVCARCQGVVSMSQKKWASGESPAIN